MRLLLDSASEGGGDNAHVETIVLNVVSPKQDFAAQGGIHDALVALRQLDEYYTALNNKFKGGFHFGGAGSSVNPTGEIKLTIAGSAIQAALAPGEKIKLTLSGSDFTVGGSAAGGSPSTSGSGTGGTGGMAKPIVPGSSGSGRLLYEVTDEGAEGARLRKRRYASGNFDRSFREITYGEEEAIKSSTLHDKPAAESAAAVSANILAKKDQLQQAILKGTESEVSARRLLASAIRDEVKASEALNDLQKNRYAAMASRLDVGAASMEKRQANRQQIQMFRSQIAQEDAAQSEAVEQASRNVKARRIVRDRQEARQQAAQEAADEQTDAQYRRARSQAVRGLGDAYAGIPAGVTPAQRRQLERAADVQYHGSLRTAAESAGPRYDDRAAGHYRDEQAALMGLRAETDRFNGSTRLIGKNMLTNIAHVTTWAASVGILYGSIRLLTRSLEENMEIAKQEAILSQIFKGNSLAVKALTSDVIELASVNGQSAKEAMQSATEFARIYGTQREILQATSAALIQANITGEEAAKTTEFLSAMTQVYHLHASELIGVVGQMASISQNYNVTNLNLAKGLETVAESAKVAGMNIGELLGLISGGIAGTQQSGTTIGNTVKTMITQMSNPEIQQKLRFQGIDVTEQGFGLKEMPQIFRDIVTGYERMNDAEKRSLLFNVGGRQNSTRMAAILDNYIKGQMEAINGQLNMNAAQQENSKIMDTLKGQTAGLVAEWDRFVKIQGDRGPMSMLTNITEGFKNLIRVANAPGVNVLTTLMGGIGLAVGAKTLLTGYGASAQLQPGQKSANVLMNTGAAIRASTADLSLWYASVVSSQRAAFGFSGALVQASYGMGALGTASRATLASISAMRSALPLIAAYLGVVAANKLFRALSSDDQLESLQKAQTQAGGRADAYRSQGNLYATVSGILSDPNVPASEKSRVLSQIAGSSGEGSVAQRMMAQGRGADVAAYYGMRGAGSEAAARQADAQHLSLLRQEMNLRLSSTDGTFRLGMSQTLHDLGIGGQDMGQAGIETAQRVQEIQMQMREIQARQSEAAREHGPGYLAQQILERSAGSFPQAFVGGISAQFSQLGTGDSATSALHRNIAEYETQARFWQDRNDQIQAEINRGVTGPRLQLLEKARAAAEAGIIDTGSKLADESDPFRELQTRNQDRLKTYERIGRAEFGGMAIGLTPGEQMAEQQRRGMGRLNQIGMEAAMAGGISQSDAAEALQIELGLKNNLISAQEKIIDLKREEINLNIQATREYERSLLTSSPAELLRKMAVSGLTRGRGIDGKNAITGGEFFSMSQEAREEFLRLPGNTEAERMARRGRLALEHQFGRLTPYQAGEMGARNSVPTSHYRGMIPNSSPSISISADHIATVVAFSDELRSATVAVINFKASLVPAAPTHPTTHSAPPVAQAPTSLPGYMAFGAAH